MPLADKPVTPPLTRAMCAPLSDGAAAAIVCSEQVLSTLDAPYGGLWRMAVGDVEVALLTDLTPEGRVAATRLLTNDAPRVVVIPIEGDLLSWWRTTGGADPIGWTGSEGQDIADAVKQAAPAAE